MEMKIKGYTLVEMMVVVALLSVVGVAVVAMFLTTSKGGGKAGAIALVKQEGDYALTTMERYIHFAKSVDTAACITTPSSLSIIVPDLNPTQPDKTVVFSTGGASQILRTIDGVDAFLTSTTVQVGVYPSPPLSFTCAVSANGVVTVDIDFGISNIGKLVSEEFHTKVVLRNKSE